MYPDWLKIRFYDSYEFHYTKSILKRFNLRTVCQEARCPNLSECFSKGRLTFLILGDRCSRSCSFCFIKKGIALTNKDEPDKIIEAIKTLKLRHIVITSVSRDDLEDKGANTFSMIIRKIKMNFPQLPVEALIPDFLGEEGLIRMVCLSGVDILSHNIETVPRLYSLVRPQASYQRSLKVLKIAKKFGSLTKSGMMLGLGETEEEVFSVMKDLRKVGVEIFTIGQYLSPGRQNLKVERFVRPEEFQSYKNFAYNLGFSSVSAGPFIRSSYHAEQSWKQIKGGKRNDRGYFTRIRRRYQ